MAVGVEQQHKAATKQVPAVPQDPWSDPKWSQYKVCDTLPPAEAPSSAAAAACAQETVNLAKACSYRAEGLIFSVASILRQPAWPLAQLVITGA